jgi:hypothetical protein
MTGGLVSMRSSVLGMLATAGVVRGNRALSTCRVACLAGVIAAGTGCPSAPGGVMRGAGSDAAAAQGGTAGPSNGGGAGSGGAGSGGGGGSAGSGSAGIGGGGGSAGSGADGAVGSDGGGGGGHGGAQSDAGAREAGAGPAADGGNARFSFFVTSLRAMQRLSGSQVGFGGDLRFGQPDGLEGADEICRRIAETSMPGSGAKGWRAFLSVTKGPDGRPVHAIDRVGEGPWYDRLGRLVAQNKADLVQDRPRGGDPLIIHDLPNEDGVPNHAPDGQKVDNHDILTGSDARGQLYSADWSSTCHDWTSKVGRDGRPRVGHSWPRRFGPGFPPHVAESWISVLDEAGCAPGVSLVEMGPPDPNVPTVGSGGGYGGIYCFALSP